MDLKTMGATGTGPPVLTGDPRPVEKTERPDQGRGPGAGRYATNAEEEDIF